MKKPENRSGDEAPPLRVPIGAQETSRRHAQLMERAQKGDRDAFRSLLDDIAPLITRYVRRRISDSSEVEDVFQETLLAIYESRHTYEPARPLEPWLFAIARNVSNSHARRHRSRTRFHELVDELPDHSCAGEASTALNFRQALGRLPQSHLEALRMTKIDGLSLHEASQRSGTSIGALKLRVYRAYRMLKKSVAQ